MMNRLSKVVPRGFTLVELLIVVAIVGILVTIVIIAIDPAKVIKNSQDTKRRTELNQIKTSLQLYFNDYKRYPTTTEFTTEGSAPDFTPTYMRKLPTGYTINYDISSPVPAGEYRAGVDLNLPSTEGDDGGTKTKCDSTKTPSSGGTWATSDYFICPD